MLDPAPNTTGLMPMTLIGMICRLAVPKQFTNYVLNNPDDGTKKLQRPQYVALGPTEQEYYAVYTTVEGTDRYKYGQPFFNPSSP